MKVVQYDSNLLINFYMQNGLEFNKNKKYFGDKIKSYAILDGKTIVGAISFSNYKGLNYIEAIVIDKSYRQKGYGKMLLDKVILELEKPVYIISKNDKFFHDYGFQYSDIDLINKECKTCNKYNVTCFPKVMFIGGNKYD